MKQKIINYIEELERKAQDGERYFKYWHKEYHKNKQAIEYIDFIRNSMCISEDYVLTNILEILKGEDNE